MVFKDFQSFLFLRFLSTDVDDRTIKVIFIFLCIYSTRHSVNSRPQCFEQVLSNDDIYFLIQSIQSKIVYLLEVFPLKQNCSKFDRHCEFVWELGKLLVNTKLS